MARTLKAYKESPPIISNEEDKIFYLIDEKNSALDMKSYYNWGQKGHQTKLFGKSHSSFTMALNQIGLISKIDFSGSKTLALRFSKPVMGTATIRIGFSSKDKINIDLFFAYLTSSLFLLDALEKSRIRRAEFVRINQIDFYLIFRFPNLSEIKNNPDKLKRILEASNRYNTKIPLKDRPPIPQLIQKSLSNEYPLLKELDEAWFDALYLPVVLVDSLYQEIADRLYDISEKKPWAEENEDEDFISNKED
jgi:hypothetical protein